MKYSSLLILSRILPICTSFTSSILPNKAFLIKLNAASGPPQYDKIDAIMKDQSNLADGSVMLHVETVDQSKPLDYKPGHVIALEIQSDTDPDEWLRGPYTVSRCTDTTFDILVKTVGTKSFKLASCEKGTPLKFGGKFKVPILDGIQNDEELEKIVFISTGVGIGPMVGAIELALKANNFPMIQLVALYKKEKEIVYKEYLDRLSDENTSKFKWNTVISDEEGRVASSTENLIKIFGEIPLTSTHFHLIGNGQMVNEWKSGLLQGGIAEDRVTIEQYFNHKATSDEETIKRIASFVSQESKVVA